MRSCICRISPPPPPSMRRWNWPDAMDAPEDASFANGILGAFVRGELPPERADAVDTQAEDKKDGA